MTYSVHNEPDFERVYDEDDMIEVRRGDLRGLLDLATGSMNFSSGFWCNEDVEIARGVAAVLDVDPDVVTPSNFKCQYIGHHEWENRYDDAMKYRAVDSTRPIKQWYCHVCGEWSEEPKTF